MRCPACDFENPPRMRFCGQCGTALAGSASPGEERKLVTVLFADVVGSTRRSASVDPEQVREQMTRFFEIAREEVRRFGGTVEKFIGDAVMAVFGLPVIHEDDPERAAEAAAALRARVRSEVERGALPEIRISINTGEVVANAQAVDKGEFLVTGEAVNLAARLQQHAAPGQVLIGERTMLALHGAAQLRPVPQLAVKGAAAPLPAWELLEVTPAHEREVRATPFVGRTEELDLLRGYVRRMRRQDQITRALEHLEPALALSREVEDPSLTGRILNHIGFTYFNISRHEEAIRSHQEARRLLEGCGDLAGVAESLHGLGENSSFLGRFPEGIRWLSESAEVSDQIGARSLSGENRYMIAYFRHVLGKYAEAQVEVQRSVDTLTEIGDVWNSAFALGIVASIATTLGQFGKALEHAARGLRLARQIGASRAATLNLIALSAVHREMENHRDARQAAHEAADLARTGEVAAFRMPVVLSSLALDEAALGRTDVAQDHIDEAERTLAAGPSREDFRQDITHAEGRVLLAVGKPAQAADTAKALVEKAVATNTLHWRIPALLLLADAPLALGDPAGAVPVYEAAAAEAERLGRTPALWRALAGLAEAQRALGQAQGSAARAGRAREIIDRLAATVPDERLRATFLQSAKVQRVAALAGA